ncbi:MAG: hypothetical protein ACFCGT_19820 [Sandaracinaceae bacterium]
MSPRLLLPALLGLAGLGLGGCLTEQRYITPESGGPWVFALEEDTPAFVESEDGSVFVVEERITFPLREPTERELEEMVDLQGLEVPYPTLPFVRRGDYEVQVDWVLSNLSDGGVRASVVINGINEFHEYLPQAQVADDEVILGFSQWERLFDLGPGERIVRTVREEELDEVAVDLATVVNGAPNPDQIVYFQNHSSTDLRSQRYIPDVIPALVGVRVGVQTEAAAPLVLEVTVRVRDERGVLWQGSGEMPWELPEPAPFPEPVAMDPMMAAQLAP